MRVMYSTLKRRKSVSSQAASISAWCAVFDCPSIVAAFIVSRHGPASSSAARRKTAARSSHGQRDHDSQAAAAASTACCTCSAPTWWTSASTCSLSCGITAGVVPAPFTSLPPITAGISIRSPRICSSRRSRLARSGLPGAYSWMGSFRAGGGRNKPCVLISGVREEPGRGGHHPDHEPQHRGPEGGTGKRPVGCRLAGADTEPADDPERAVPARTLPRVHRREGRADDDGRRSRGAERGELDVPRHERRRLERQVGRAAEDDDGGEEAVRVVADEPRPQAAEEPDVREAGDGEEGLGGAQVVAGDRERDEREPDVGVAACREVDPHRAATLQHSAMQPRLVRYDAGSFGVGELWLSGDRVVWSELPRPSETCPAAAAGHVLAGRLAAFFAGGEDDFADVELELDDGFYGDLQRALPARAVRPVPPRRRRRRNRRLRLARRRLQTAPAGARACRSLKTCGTSS